MKTRRFRFLIFLFTVLVACSSRHSTKTDVTRDPKSPEFLHVGGPVPVWAGDLLGSNDVSQNIASISGSAGGGGNVPLNISAFKMTGTTFSWVDSGSISRDVFESTHGRFTAGGGGTDDATIIGPATGAESSASGVWLLPNATSPTLANITVEGDGTNTLINTRSATGSIQFLNANSTFIGMFDGNAKRWFVGGSTAASPLIIDWATTNQTQILAGSNQTSMLIGAIDVGSTLNMLAGGSSAIQFANGTQNGVALGSFLATVGHGRLPSGFQLLARNVGNTANNTIFGDDGANNIVMGTGYGTVTFNPTTSFTIATPSQIVFESGGDTYEDQTTLHIRNAAHTEFLQIVPASPVLLRDSGGVTRDSIDTVHGRFQAGGGGTDAFAQIGPLVSFESSNAALWLLAHGATATGLNPVVYSDGSSVNFNSPSAAGNVNFTFGGSTFALACAEATSNCFFGGSSTTSPILLNWGTATSPIIQSGTNATALTLGTNKAGATLTLQADAASTVATLSSGLMALGSNAITFGATPATTGEIRAPNNITIIAARNGANTTDLPILQTTNADQIIIGTNDASVTLGALGGWGVTYSSGGTFYSSVGNLHLGTNAGAGFHTFISSGAGTDVIDVTVPSVGSENSAFTGSIDMKPMTAPSTPAANTVRIYTDTGDGKLKGKDANGNIFVLVP